MTVTIDQFKNRWPNFLPKEFACDCGKCGEASGLKMDAYTLDKLQTVREEMGIPFIITSGYRCANHPAEAKKKQPGTHNMGKAVDIAVRGNEALQLIAVAQCYGFTGIGVAQKGGGRFIHLDDAQAAPRRPRPHIWSY